MRFLTALSVLGWLASRATAMPQPEGDLTARADLDDRQAGGFKSVAYFVNWVSLLLLPFFFRCSC